MKADSTASASARRCESIVSRRYLSYVQWSFGSYRPLSAGSWAPLLRGLRNRVERHAGAAAAARVVSWSSCAPVTLRARRGESCVRAAARQRGTRLVQRRAVLWLKILAVRFYAATSSTMRIRCGACARAQAKQTNARSGASRPQAHSRVPSIAGCS